MLHVLYTIVFAIQYLVNIMFYYICWFGVAQYRGFLFIKSKLGTEDFYLFIIFRNTEIVFSQ